MWENVCKEEQNCNELLKLKKCCTTFLVHHRVCVIRVNETCYNYNIVHCCSFMSYKILILLMFSCVCFCHQLALLCGAPGLGKTTLAHIIAQHAGYHVVEMNARLDN